MKTLSPNFCSNQYMGSPHALLAGKNTLFRSFRALASTIPQAVGVFACYLRQL
jgi:hypothetical protein